MATREVSNQERESNRKKFSNWLQCVNSLNETKTSLHDHVLEKWKKEIFSWDKDLRVHLPRFLICVSKDTISYKEDKHKRKRERYCMCGHTHCNKNLKLLLSIQQNPGSRIIWNNELCKHLAQEKLEIESDNDNDDNMENIPRIETSVLALFLQMLLAFIGLASRKQDAPAEAIRYEDIFDGCRQEHIWCIANMFMHHGKNESKIANSGPRNTDASMFFRMMQNCKLFEIEDQNNLYEEMLSCRNRLHHSANNRVSQKDAENHLDTMITFLKQFEEVPICKDAIESIEKAQKETILSVSVPDKTLKELSEKALKLKKTALEVDREIDRSSGFTSDESNGLLEKTTKELEKISEQPSGELSNTESGIRGNSKCTADEYIRKKDPCKHFENITKLVKIHAGKEVMLEALAEQLNPLLDQIVEDVSWKDEEIKESLKVVYEEEKHEYEREKEENAPFGSDLHLNQIVEDASGNDEEIKESLESVYDQERHESKREKEENMPIGFDDTPDQTSEVASDFGDDISEHPDECIEQETHGHDSDKDFEQTKVNNFGMTKERLDQIVEDASGNDEEIKESLEGVYDQERLESKREKEENMPIGFHDTDAEDVDVQSPDVEEHDNSEHLKSNPQLRSTSGVTSTQTNSSHVWSVESEQTYTIKVEGDSADSDINGCCMLPTGEILLADLSNCRLKKVNDRYQVISVCDLPRRPRDVCYCGNNEAVLAMFGSLQFVDVRGGMSLTRKVRTDHLCHGLTCHGNQLYVVDNNSVYKYNTNGIKQRVMYTLHSDGTFFRNIAVSDDGSYIYITDYRTGLHTIDSVGNHLYKLTDTDLYRASGVCVDDEGQVLVSQHSSDKVLQLSSDGKQKLGIIVNNISDDLIYPTICFNRSNATLIVAGQSNKKHVLKLK